MTDHEPTDAQTDWVLLEACPDPMAAQVLAGLLEANGIAAQLRTIEPFPGLEHNAQVHVPRQSLARARQVLNEQRPTEQELTELALGGAAPQSDGPDGKP